MNSIITSDERALIDAAIAQGRVCKVPAGTSSFGGYRYDKVRGGLVPVDADQRGWRSLRPTFGNGQNRGKITPHVAKRRLRIREMIVRGKRKEEILTALHIASHVWDSDIKAMKAEGYKLVTPRGKGRDPKVEARREMVRDMHQRGLSNSEMADHLREPVSKIHHDLSDLGLKANKPRATPERLERRAKVADLLSAGMSLANIASRLGVTPKTVANDRKHIMQEAAQ